MALIRNQVLDLIRREILACALRPGEELREAALADRYRVSKSPVREALQRLQFEGLIETEPRRGHRVTRISIGDARDILNMREILESWAVRRAVRDASDEDLAALDTYRDADVSRAQSFTAQNYKFHVTVASLSGNRRLAAETRGLLHAYERLCLVSLGRLKDEDGDFSSALKDHRDLIDALQARDGRAAARISRRHVRQSRTQIIRGLDARAIVD